MVEFATEAVVLDFGACIHEKTFPHLAKMARQFLGCPASSALWNASLVWLHIVLMICGASRWVMMYSRK
jgi:hypothetical protein